MEFCMGAKGIALMEVFGSFWGVKKGVFGAKNGRFSTKKITRAFSREPKDEQM